MFKGYVLNGSATSMCNEVGEWSNNESFCDRISCGMAPLVENALHDEDQLHFGDYVSYKCNYGYETLFDFLYDMFRLLILSVL